MRFRWASYVLRLLPRVAMVEADDARGHDSGASLQHAKPKIPKLDVVSAHRPHEVPRHQPPLAEIGYCGTSAADNLRVYGPGLVVFT